VWRGGSEKERKNPNVKKKKKILKILKRREKISKVKNAAGKGSAEKREGTLRS